MKRRVKVVAILCIVLLCLQYMFYFGNPIAYYRSVKTAKQFISDNYPEYQYIRTRNNYWAGLYTEVAVPGSKDQHFLVWTDYKGDYTADTHSYILNNVEDRLSEKYEETVKSLLCDLLQTEKINAYFMDIPEKYLVMDKEYSLDEISELSQKYGYISVYTDGEIPLEEAASYIKNKLKENNLYFWKIYVGVSETQEDKYLDKEYFIIN